MFGAAIGDIIGSYYECHCTKDYDFILFPRGCSFTDDTVMSAAVCDAILFDPSPVHGFSARKHRALEYAARYRQYFGRYPYAGYGKMFEEWARSRRMYRLNSFGNGAAMRAVGIGYAYETIEEVLIQAKLSACYTHNDRDGIKGAQAVAAAVFMAHNRCSKNEIKEYIQKNIRYPLSFTIASIKEKYDFDSSACCSVPPSIVCFLESTSYEDAVRKAVSLGGDADTMACIAGGIAEAYGEEIPHEIYSKGISFIDAGLKSVFKSFNEKYLK